MKRGASMAPANAPSLSSRLAEKKQELQYVQQIQRESGQLADELETLKEKLETLADGTEAVSLVMTNWHSVLRAVSLASTSLSKYKEEDFEPTSEATPLPETLVRIRLDEDE